MTLLFLASAFLLGWFVRGHLATHEPRSHESLDCFDDCYATCRAGDRVESGGALLSSPWIASTVDHVAIGYMSGERVAVHLVSGAILFKSQRARLRYAS